MIATLVFAAVVAVTFDDLPNIHADLPLPVEQAITTKLLAAITAEHVPAIGFVNEDKIEDDGAMVAQWLDAGLEIGNHTYSHMDLDASSPAQFEDDVVRGEEITRPLIESRGKKLQWFRHPYLNTGKTAAIRDEVDAFLAARGYRVAPVTIDSSEWIYDDAYDRAAWWQRPALRRSYLRYMQRRFAFAEASSGLVFHRNIAHILLLHASSLNADTFPQLVRLMRKRGYRFVTIDEATLDAAYATPEHWTGGGAGWLERWGVARGIAAWRFESDPKVPPWVEKLAGSRDE